MSDIQVIRVATRSEFREFLKFPKTVYREDPNWVPPLLMEMKEKLDRNRHPFFEHAEMDLFLCRRGGKTTGRIAAVIDDNHNAYQKEKTGFFGLFECLDDPEAARALVNAAADWVATRGMERLRGPVNLSLNDECGLLIDGFDSPPVIMMPYNPRYYADLLESCGLAKIKDLFAYMMRKKDGNEPRVNGLVAKIRGENKFALRKVILGDIQEEARRIAVIYNDAWSKNWGFVPWTENEMKHMAAGLKKFADPNLVIFAEYEGQPVGFAFGLPNYNEILIRMNGRLFPFGIFKLLLGRKKIKCVRAPVFGVLEAFRNTGLSYLLFDELYQASWGRGADWGEMSWLLEDNDAVNRFSLSLGARHYKTYRIYEKPIEGREAVRGNPGEVTA